MKRQQRKNQNATEVRGRGEAGKKIAGQPCRIPWSALKGPDTDRT